MALLLGAVHEDSVGRGVNFEGVLDEPVEQHPSAPGRAPVEAERELIEVVGQAASVANHRSNWARVPGYSASAMPNTTHCGHLREGDSPLASSGDRLPRHTSLLVVPVV